MDKTELLQQLNTLEYKLPAEIPSNDTSMQILSDMYFVAKTQTYGFSDPTKISDKEIDIRPILKRENVEPSRWVKFKSSFNRSEKQALEWLLSELNKRFSGNKSKDSDLDLLELEFEAAALKLKLLKI